MKLELTHLYASLGIVWLFVLYHAQCITWMTLYTAPERRWNMSNPIPVKSCWQAGRKYGFARSQARLCTKHTELLPSLIEAAKESVQVCQLLFQDRRWNCSSLLKVPHLTPDLTAGTREQAFVYALGSAAVVQSVARACATGQLLHCNCGALPSDPPTNFKWGGCGDNVRYGMRFGKRFTDVPDRERVGPALGLTTPPMNSKITKSVSATMNRHNSRVGRKVAENSLQRQCKCHGVSGSCNIKTCWKALPQLKVLGEKLKRKYALAVEVTWRRTGAGSRKLMPVLSSTASHFNEEDLVYVRKSPDYCTADARVGSLGTRGRSCNATSSSPDGCHSLCCGRGYTTEIVEKVERCHCKYYWCCYVRCKTCKKQVAVHSCL